MSEINALFIFELMKLKNSIKDIIRNPKRIFVYQTVDKISGTRYYEKGSLFFMKQKRRGEGRCYQRNRMQDIK